MDKQRNRKIHTVGVGLCEFARALNGNPMVLKKPGKDGKNITHRAVITDKMMSQHEIPNATEDSRYFWEMRVRVINLGRAGVFRYFPGDPSHCQLVFDPIERTLPI